MREDNEQVKRPAHCAFFRSNRDWLLTGQENKTQYAINSSKPNGPGKIKKDKKKRGEHYVFVWNVWKRA